LMIHNN